MNKKFPHSFIIIKEGLVLATVVAFIAVAFYAIFNYKAVYSSASRAAQDINHVSSVVSSLQLQKSASNMCVDEIAADDVYFVSCGGFF